MANEYSGYPVSYRVYIKTATPIEITEDVLLDTLTISQELDIQTFGEFVINETTFIVSNKDNKYGYENDNNIFLTNMFNRSGYRCPILIRAGFDVNGTITDDIIFEGQIISIDETIKEFELRITCGNPTIDFYDKAITDFGIQRYGKLDEDEDGRRTNISASYPFGKFLDPVSDESLSGTSGSSSLVIVDELATEGKLNPLNIVIDESEMLTEGGQLSTDPVIEAKGPYRNKTINGIITRILDYYNITNRNIEIPDIATGVNKSFYSVGRPGFDIEATVSSNTNFLEWSGFVSSFIEDTGNNRYYFLYNTVNSSNYSKIIQYDITTDTISTIYTHSVVGIEFWKLVQSGNDLFIGTFYQSSPTQNEGSILKFTLGTNITTELVAKTDSYPFTCVIPYVVGYDDESPATNADFLPDTRGGFYIYNNKLYYRYLHPTQRKFGVASIALTGGSTTSIYAADTDYRRSMWNHDFIINGSTLYTTAIWNTGDRTKKVIASKAL